ncbi:MAG: thioredoxin fold domain-containing protein [Candidatus Adiutrix sp.]|nr:thioredoxin fold domain-containing protein [Candidatus Adiutrix sp.]
MTTEIKRKILGRTGIRQILLTLALWLGAAFPAGAGEFQYRGLDEALKLAEAENKLVMIFFWAEWCVYCGQIRREVFTEPKVHEVFDRDFLAVSVDIEQDPGELARKYRARSLPTLVFLNAASEIVGILPGAVDQETFLKILEYLVENHKGSKSAD